MPEERSLFIVCNTQMSERLCRSPSKRRANIFKLSDQRRQAWQGISPHTIIRTKRIMVKCERQDFSSFYFEDTINESFGGIGFVCMFSVTGGTKKGSHLCKNKVLGLLYQ